MKLQKKDFIEIEFTGKTNEGKVFDSNTKEGLDELHVSQEHKDDHTHETKPLIYCLGEDMFLKGVDNYLIGKEIGKYEIELKPEEAFGKRDSKLIQMIPMKVFIQHKMNPVQGATLDFDGKRGRILSVSGGRVLVDFNNPLAGKEVIYTIKVKRKIEDTNEKIKAFNSFLFKKDFKFEIKGKKIIYESEGDFKKFLEMFKDKFKEIFGLELEVKEPKKVPKKQVKKEDKK